MDADETNLGLTNDAPLLLQQQGEITISGRVARSGRVVDPATGEYVIRTKAGERVYLVYDEERNLYVRHYPQPGEKVP